MENEKSLTKRATSKSMYLRSLQVQNFRSCLDCEVEFQPDLTLLVGENNSGKSNVINALRLATTPLSRRRTRYFEPEDVTFGGSGPITLTAQYAGLTPAQQGHFMTALEFSSRNTWLTTRYTPNLDFPRSSVVEQLSGKVPSLDPEPEKREQINHVYLPPLRDAQRHLDSSASGQLSVVMQHLFGIEERDRFLNEANSHYAELAKHQVIVGTREHIQAHLSDLTSGQRAQQIGIGFQDTTIGRLAGGLRIKMADVGIELADIADSGLGYANLLFMATVILELRNAQDSELTLFLVEEPEAHLHPQLQSVLLDYLRDQAEQSGHDDELRPAGKIQVVATTHSPNLASAVGTSSVVVLRPTEKVIEPAEGARSTVQITTPLVLDRVPLSPEDRIKIDQYLDVTRSELLFTRRAILVEGISEAVLLPILAKHCVFSKQDDRDKLRWKRFCATSIINLGMVDFEPYVKLLLHPQNGVSLIDKLVIVTDGDPDITEDGDKSAECLEDDSISIASDIQPASVSTDSRATPTKGAGEKRAEELTKIAKDLGVEKSLFIAQSRYTLEADLLDPFTTNGPLIKEVFLKHKPNSGKFWQSVEESADHALTFYKKLVGTRRFVRKGEYAHQISSLIREGAPFECPKYLRAAITSVVEDGK